MKVLACYNIKGGVGKTATTVNLSYLAAAEGLRTLVWDLDPQGAASFYFRVKPKVKGGSDKLLRDKEAPAKRIKGTDFERLDLLPADFSFRNLDLTLDGVKKPVERLRKVLKSLAGEYDYVFLDCAPAISLASESVFHAADALLVPTIPTPLSLRTLHQLVEFRREAGLERLRLLPFYSMLDRRRHLHRLVMNTPSQALPPFLRSAIPESEAVEKMGVRRAPLASFAAGSRPARAYQALWREVRAAVEG